MRLSKSSIKSLNKFKTRKAYILLLSEVIMVENLKMKFFESFVKTICINPNFSTSRTPQQNGIVERNNIS